jgi:BASS family bile acid:Na+ symporter
MELGLGLAPAAKVFTIVFLVATMLSIGLKVTVADLASSARNRGWMARSLAANFLLIPAIGLLLATVIPMSVDIKIGFLLLAFAPGGPNAIQFTSKTTEGLPYAATILFILSFLSVLVSPLMAAAVIPTETPLVLPYGKVIGYLLLGVIGPMLVGLAVHRVWGRIAHMLAKPIAMVGTVSFVVVVVLLWGLRKEAKAAVTTSELAAMLIFIVVAMVIGWALGGPGKETRRVLATASSMRNVALGLMIAVNSFPDTMVDEAVIAFGALMIPLNMVFTIYGVIQGRRAKRRAGADVSEPVTKDAR